MPGSISALALLTLALLGPGFLFSGLSRLAEAADKGPNLNALRTKQLASFATSLRAWEEARPKLLLASVRLAYRLSNASGGALPPNATVQYIDLVARADAEKLPFPSELPGWQPLVFRGLRTALAPVQQSWQPSRLKLEVEVRSGRGWAAIGSAELDWTAVSSTRSASWKECANRHGVFRPGNCTVFRVLSTLCLVVDVRDEPAAKPRLPRLQLTPADSRNPTDSRCRTPGKGGYAYRAVPPPHGRTGPAALPTTTPFGPLSVSVRSSFDPMIAAAALTNGSLSLGPSAEEQRRSGTLLVCLGVLLGLPPLALALSRCLGAVALPASFAHLSAHLGWMRGRQRVPTADPAGPCPHACTGLAAVEMS